MKFYALLSTAVVLIGAAPGALSTNPQVRGAVATDFEEQTIQAFNKDEDEVSYDVVEVSLSGDDPCPEGQDLIEGVCRSEPDGPRPTCANGRTVIRACYRPKTEWWQCEKNCGLGPPNPRRPRRPVPKKSCPEGQDLIKGVCRSEPDGPRPTCANGRTVIRACYRPKTEWWQCEKDCGLGPPDRSNGRRSTPPPETHGLTLLTSEHRLSTTSCPEGQDLIEDVCRSEPDGPRPTCPNGNKAIRACYRPNTEWWQCEKDCELGPPDRSNGRRSLPPPEASYGFELSSQ